MGIYADIQSAKHERRKCFAVLIDPDKWTTNKIPKLLDIAHDASVDYLLVGGSLLVTDRFHEIVQAIKKYSNIPIVLFPGDQQQISATADAILFLSLISGRNADLLIGKHVQAAPKIKASGIEVISTGYMLIESGNFTTAHYISNTLPIPRNKPEIAVSTAMAGEMLGLSCLYLDGGSGAQSPVPLEMVSAVSQAVTVPIFVGGGIKEPEHAYRYVKGGADILVVGNIFEEDPKRIREISEAIHSVLTPIQS